jgi:2-polyprenyl-3-methyl-5-hydroxy-6-metoxy-1,4-benzoquinol methylase/glycosyltransferase involved in cell wall biosynthesis
MRTGPLLIAQLDAMHQSRGGDWYYRTFAPGRALAELPGVYVVNLDQAHRNLPLLLERADVLVINGVCSADLLPVIEQRKQARRLTLFEINDDVQAMQPSNPLAAFFANPENLRLFRRLALSSDAVQYSVPELERLYGSLNRRGRVFENQLAELPPLRPTDADAALAIGWGGSAGHLEDLAEIAAPLVSFVRSQPNVTLHLMCSDKIWQLFEALPAEQKQRTRTGSLDDYYAFVSQLDIGIAPNRDVGFNRARSDVKFLEYAGWGAVPVLQRLTPYLRSVKPGETGFLFEAADELIATLGRLVNDASERRRIRENARAYVAGQRLQSQHAAERLAYYDELLPADYRAGEAEALFQQVSGWAGAETSGRHALLAHTRFETLLHDGLVLLQQPSGRARGEAMLREAARLEPQQAQPELVLGVELQSEAELGAALSKQPRSVQGLLALGSVLLARGQARAALERFLAAAELAPGYELPFAHAARAVAQLGGVKEAAEFENIAQTLARAVTPVTPAAMPSAARPAWHLLDQDMHLQTLNPSYAPTGLLEMVAPAPKRVLDVGCFCGGSGRFLKRRFPGCEVVGVEMLAKAAAMAAEVYDRVLVGALEAIDLEREGILPGSFDAIIAADVLEHMYHPWQTLQRLRPLLAPGGALYVSLPNLRNVRILSELAKGRFQYAGAGILDVTHIRFFTRKSALEMLEQTGFAVDDLRVNPDPSLASLFEGKDLGQLHELELDGLKLVGLGLEDVLELSALQFYLRATPS